MKILIHDYAGHPFQVDLSRELARRGHRIVHGFFAGDPGPKGLLRTRPGDPETLSFKPFEIARSYNKSQFIQRRFRDIDYGREVEKHISSSHYDLVISGNTPTEAQQRIMSGCSRARTHFVFWIQDFYSVAVSRILARKLPVVGSPVSAFYRHLEKRQLRRSDAVVVITEGFHELAARWGGNAAKVHLIENWGAIGDIKVIGKKNPWAIEHGLENSFVFLYSGTLGLKHNPDFLLALAQLKLPGTKVVVVGQGNGFDKLTEMKNAQGLDNLVMLPLQPFERFSEVLASGDVLVAVIEEDAGQFSVPSKVQSYLCAARPILLAAPKENLAARVVAREQAGFVVDPSDAGPFLAAARQLFEERTLAQRCAENGRAYAEHAYDIGLVADRFEDVFRSIGRRKAPTTAGTEEMTAISATLDGQHYRLPID